MRPLSSPADSRSKTAAIAICAVAVWFATMPAAFAQLSITEVMSNASTNHPGNQSADFWELTNFCTNTVDLSGWSFTDNNHPPLPLPAEGLFIGPGESIVFVRTDLGTTPDAAAFRQTWGLPADHPVICCYREPGFNSMIGDSVLVFDSGGNLVDRVDFGPAPSGFSITYDPNTGHFGVFSKEGVGGAWKTTETGDVGSPGVTSGSVPLQIIEGPTPTNQVVIPGMDAEFRIEAIGMPRPKYQWRCAGIPITDATDSVLRISNVSPSMAGIYDAVVSNCCAVMLLSSAATLVVDTNLCPPLTLIPPKDVTAFPGQNARFSVSVVGYPVPTLQWFSNGIAIPDETNHIFTMGLVTLEMSGTKVCVEAVNPLGSTNACALLTVTNKPKLRLTEVMARRPTYTRPHKDWFEVTSYDTNAVDLLGYRFVCTQLSGFGGAQTVQQHVIIKPGESVVFADALTRDDFLLWWGADNLPCDLQVITYAGFGISPDTIETLYLWNPSAEDPSDAVAQIFTMGDFSEGISKRYDFDSCPAGCDSLAGEQGAFPAAQGTEIGSPGYDSAPKLEFLRCGGIEQDQGGIVLKGRSVVNTNYVLQFKNNLLDPDWSDLSTQPATNACIIFRDGPPQAHAQRFYRLSLKALP